MDSTKTSALSRPLRVHEIRLKFEPRDLWIGVFWKRKAWFGYGSSAGRQDFLTIYLCILPTLPLIVTLTWGLATGRNIEEEDL